MLPIEIGGGVNLTPDVWLGAAFVHHAGVGYKGDGFYQNVDFQSANGGTLEAGWRNIGLTYTALSYTDEFDSEFDASSLGVTLRFGTPLR